MAPLERTKALRYSRPKKVMGTRRSMRLPMSTVPPGTSSSPSFGPKSKRRDEKSGAVTSNPHAGFLQAATVAIGVLGRQGVR